MSRVARDPWVVAALLVGLLLRLVRLGTAPLWFDEVLTARWLEGSWTQMLSLCLHDNHPPLYFALAKLAHDWIGPSAWAVRLPSALVGTLAVPLVAAVADVLSGLRAARWAAWFAALAPILVHHAQEARMYALVATFAAANLLALARWTTGRSERLGALYALSALGLVGTHYYSVFYVGGTALAAIMARPRPVGRWLPAVATAAAGCVTGLLLAMFLATHHAGGSYTLGWITLPGTLWALIAGYALLPDTFALHEHSARAALPYVPVALVAAPIIAACGVFGLRAAGRPGLLALVLPLVPALLAPLLMPFVLDVAINPRYFQTVVPALLVLLALGASSELAARRVGPALGVGLAGVLAAGTVLHLAEPGHGREDIADAGTWLAAHVAPTQPLLVTSHEMAELARYHWARWPIIDYPPDFATVDGPRAERLAERLAWRDGRAVYVFGRAWASDPDGALEHAIQRRWPSCGTYEARGIRIYCLEQSNQASAKSRS
jgi:uncharacterized membrane protein